MSKKKKQKFGDIWTNQTNLGRQFNLTSVAMGKKLKELGLRNADGTPTEAALRDGFCKSTPLKDGTPFYMWHQTKVGDLLKSQGFTTLDDREIRCRELAEDLIKADRQYRNAKDGLEEKSAILWQDSIYDEMRSADKPLVNRFLKELGSNLQVD